MNNKLNDQIVIGVIIVVVALGALWYILPNSWGASNTSEQNSAVVVPTPSAVPVATVAETPKKVTTASAPAKTTQTPLLSGYNSISYLLGLKQSLSCEVKSTTPSRSGTMYVSAGKMRGNFSTGTMLDDGSFLYAWTDGSVTGLKLPAAVSSSGSAIVYKGGLALDTPLSFTCYAWTVQPELLTPPAQIVFSNNP